jgi:Fe-S cluster biogenesis protein NfuA
MEETIELKIQEVLNKIRPFLQNDGGDIEFVEFKDGIVYVSVLGACVDCIGLDSTIRDGVEMILMEEVEGVIGVEVVNSQANQ